MFLSILTLCVIHGIFGEEVVPVPVTTNELNVTTSFPILSSSTQAPENISCKIHKDCKSCVANAKCYYCDTDGRCDAYVEHLVPTTCGLKNAHYLTCKVNFQYMMIIVGVLVGITLLIIVITCCYCCCKKKGVKISKDDIKWARQKEERQQIAAEKRKERAERTDEIRRKYGLAKDSNAYERFDA